MDEGDGGGGGGGCGEELVVPDDGAGHLLVRVHVPELNVQKCLQFPRDRLVWDVKQQCLAALPKELKESFNYGLFYPPDNGRAGKFLDEERRLGDYPFNGPVGYLELKYKRRVYKAFSLDEKQLKSLHTRANLRRFLDYVHNGQTEKITKMCSKGLDPNFHCPDTGGTPLTIATTVKKAPKVLMALVNGGALLDYRSRCGSTALHRAVEAGCLDALRTLLELGASPNYKDQKGLTALYLAVALNADAAFAETLLHDHATIGAQDAQGWHEVHQACKSGLLGHLEHLLFYGADTNCRNASGNTPLHVCAVNGQESCARLLLFRGADGHALNYANQTAAQVAVIAGNMDLAETIQNYRQEDVVPFRGPPLYNPKRRSAALGWLPPLHAAVRPPAPQPQPPSPCPSDRSSAPFSSASSSLSDGSSGANRHHHHLHLHLNHLRPGGGAAPGREVDTASIVTVLALGVADKSLGDTSDIISDSSGVGTANSDTNYTVWMPGTTAVCVEAYARNQDGHVSISEGDIVEVTGATDDGYLEGTVRGGGGRRSGLFPAGCVQEVRLRHHAVQPPMTVAAGDAAARVLGRRESTKHFATAPRQAGRRQHRPASGPRTVVLHKGRKGFGFVLRGAKAASPLMELSPSDRCPALQYLDDVDPGGVADVAGLKKGDFLLKIDREDVSSASHERVVNLIRRSGELVQMTVVSVGSFPGSLPTSKSGTIVGNVAEAPIDRQYATLPRNANRPGRTAQAPLPPRRDPKTTLSVGRARARSMVAGLGGGGGGGGGLGERDELAKSSSAESIHKSAGDQPRTASIRQRPVSTRATREALEELFRKDQQGHLRSSRFQNGNSSPGKGRVYASVAEMKRNKSKNSKVRFAELFFGARELRRDFHSTPDLAQTETIAASAASASGNLHRSQEDLSFRSNNRTLPPPTHPPPPIPSHVQLVKVGVSPLGGAADREQTDREVLEGVMSSFRPTASAKLYASPEDARSVGYRSKSLPSHAARAQLRKSHSARTATTATAATGGAANGEAKNQTAAAAAESRRTNPYAQPIRAASRSNSTAGGAARERRKKPISNKTASGAGPKPGQPAAPPIPEPDYSCSDSEPESGSATATPPPGELQRRRQQVENSGGSSGGSSSGGSSCGVVVGGVGISVEEIRRGRSMLRSSRSFPDELLVAKRGAGAGGGGGATAEDGDNSSSGVSSDQEVNGPNDVAAAAAAAAERCTMTLPAVAKQRQHQIGMLKRHAVSLARLPPPIDEADHDEREEPCLPPPPGFGAPAEPACVVAPPPQFSDAAARARVVGAVPKGAATLQKHGRLHSQ